MTEMVGVAIAKRAWPEGKKKTEQEVDLAEILNAKVNPNPPSDWIDGWGG